MKRICDLSAIAYFGVEVSDSQELWDSVILDCIYSMDTILVQLESDYVEMARTRPMAFEHRLRRTDRCKSLSTAITDIQANIDSCIHLSLTQRPKDEQYRLITPHDEFMYGFILESLMSYSEKFKTIGVRLASIPEYK